MRLNIREKLSIKYFKSFNLLACKTTKNRKNEKYDMIKHGNHDKKYYAHINMSKLIPV